MPTEPHSCDSLVALEGDVLAVNFISLGGFARSADSKIASCIWRMGSSKEARDAASDVLIDCRTLAEDLALAGANPSPAWADVIVDDRCRAVDALQRLASSLRTPADEGATSVGSIPMLRKRNRTIFRKRALVSNGSSKLAAPETAR